MTRRRTPATADQYHNVLCKALAASDNISADDVEIITGGTRVKLVATWTTPEDDAT